MDVTISHFISVLKQSGIMISPAESIDALQALVITGIEDREMVRATLCSTLVKNMRDIPDFDRLFDLFFSLPVIIAEPETSAAPAAGEPSGVLLAENDSEKGSEQENARAELAATDLAVQQDAPGGVALSQENADLSLFGQHLLLQRRKDLHASGFKPTFRVHARQTPPGAQADGLSFDEAGEEIDLLGDAIAALLADLRDLDIDEDLLDQLVQQLAANPKRIPALLRAYRIRDRALRAKPISVDEAARHKQNYQFNEHERRQMDEIIRRLGRQMRGAISQRKSTSHSGRINVPRTIRSNLRYDSVPFFPILSSRRNDRPKLVIICDVSLSVRNTARFMLHLVHSLQALFSKVRSFVFVSDLAEITQQIEGSSIDEAIRLVFSGEVIDVDVNSNYGRALEIFHERYLAAVTSRTTVIILGDGRGNRNEPNAWILEDLRRRAKQLIWLTPEQRGSWQLGGSDMPTYAPICHRVEVVRNLDQLGRVAEDLVRRSFFARR